MIVAAVVTIACGGGAVGELRAAYAAANTHAIRIDTGLALLDDLLGGRWSEDLTLELAMIGLPDAGRNERARTLVDEALAVTSAVDSSIRQAAASGTRVNADSVRWRRARGLACGAAAILEYEQTDRWSEAVAHLGQAAAGHGDASGRLRRVLAQVHLSKGEHKAAVAMASEVAGSRSATSFERTMAEAVLLRCNHTPDPGGVLDRAQEAWQVILLGEAMLRASEDTMSALRWIGPIRGALGRSGMSAESHGRVAANMAARLAPPEVMTRAAQASLDPAAIVGVARVADAAEWMDTLAARAAASPDAALIYETQAGCHEHSGDAFGAMLGWRNAAAVGGADSARYLDEAARAAVVVLNGGHAHRGEARDVLEQAARHGSMRAAWMRSLAAMDAVDGDVTKALKRLAEVPPAGPEHLRALAQLGALLAQRRDTIGRWTEGDRDRLEAARRAAVAAAMQRTDLSRAALAAPIAGMLAAMMIEQHLDEGDVDAAVAARRDDDAIAWLPPADRAFLDARLAAVSADCDALAAMLPEGSDALATRLVLWAGGPSAVNAALPNRPAALACVLAAMSNPTPVGPVDAVLRMAEALRRGGRCDWAVAWFDAALLEDASLLPAVLGRCECLRQRDDRAVLADVARGYRRIAAMPREDDPARWRLANVRLLEVLRRAGADPARIDARLARLRAIDPLVP